VDANRILAILADGEFHSGESLAKTLGVSRTAIWKQIGRIVELGLSVHSVKGRGYRLAEPLELLSDMAIRDALNKDAARCFPLIVVKTEVSSTNDEVKAASAEAAPFVCCAESQLAGRGRRGRHWVSPYGANVYLSLSWEFTELTGPLDGLSLCVGLAVANAVRAFGLGEVGLKWPNDIVCQGQKLAGILLEMEGELSGPVRVIIGIGINVAMKRLAGAAIDQRWTSLAEEMGVRVSRSRLIAEVLNELSWLLPKFERDGFAGIRAEWSALDVLRDAPVDLIMANRRVSGVARGVTASGELLIEGESGAAPYRAGEVSVRAAT